MAITRGTLRLARSLRRDLGAEVASLARSLTAAWVDTWDDLSPGWRRAADDMVAEAQRLDHWPRPTDLARLDRVVAAIDATEVALGKLAQRTRDEAVEAAGRVIDLDVEREARLIASQAPAAEQETLRRHLAGRVGVAEQDELRLRIMSRIRTDAVNVIRNRAAGQITSDTLPLSPQALDAVRRELIRGVDVGNNPRQTAARMVALVEGRFNGGLDRALNISRTETLDAYRGTAQQIHAANRDVVPAWQWLAELDRRTCPSCWAMHGRQFPAQEPGPDDHQQGRCSRLPVLASWAELGIAATEPPSVFVDSQARFSSLPRDVQLEIMGPRRLAMLESGQINWLDLPRLRQNPGWRNAWSPATVRDLDRIAAGRSATGR